MGAPPFTGLTDYATALAELVPDAKTSRVDADFVKDAVERYSEAYPAWEQADIGDGTTKSWQMGGSPFTGFVVGYSDLIGMRVEQLDAGAPQQPQVWLLEGSSWWLERRTVAAAPVLVLQFLDAPDATDKVRVHWRRRWTVDATPKNEVPLHHQMAVVYRAAAYKCAALASYYRRSVDSTGGSDAFSAVETADAYDRQAAAWIRDFERILGVGGPSPDFVHGRITTRRQRALYRDIP